MAGIARLGDLYGKGGVIVGSVASSVTVNGRPVALTGANYTPHFNCGPYGPQHCFGVIFGSGAGVTVEGRVPLVKGSKGTCGEDVKTASNDVKIKG